MSAPPLSTNLHCPRGVPQPQSFRGKPGEEWERDLWRRKGRSLRWRLPPLAYSPGGRGGEGRPLPEPHGGEQQGLKKEGEQGEGELDQEKGGPGEPESKEIRGGEGSSHHLSDPQGGEEKGVEED
jgi:hypothetical protein